jgi:hypothetical protein
MHANVVIVLGTEDTLPTVLSQIHQQGYGSNALVLRPRRTSIRHQLTRNGIPTANMPARVNDADAVLMVLAAARSPRVADMTRRAGAPATWIVSPNGEWNLIDDDIAAQPSRPATAPVPSPDIMPIVDPMPAPDESLDI